MAEKRRYDSKYATYMDGSDLPSKYKEEMDQLFETAEAIHGTRFVDHVKFLTNLHSLIGVMINHTEVKEGVPVEFLRDVTSTIASQLAGAYAEANHLTSRQQQEALKLCETMRGVVQLFENETRAKKR